MGWAYLTQEEAQRTIEPNTLTLSLASHVGIRRLPLPLRAQLFARHPFVSLMDALVEVRNEETRFCDAGLLQSSSVLTSRLCYFVALRMLLGVNNLHLHVLVLLLSLSLRDHLPLLLQAHVHRILILVLLSIWLLISLIFLLCVLAISLLILPMDPLFLLQDKAIFVLILFMFLTFL
jgi:hypothetical protein